MAKIKNKQISQLDSLSKVITKKRNADIRMTKSTNNSRVTSRTFYEGKVSAFNIVLKLIEDMKMEVDWLTLLEIEKD